MRPRLGFALALSVAAGLHAVIFLVPLPVGEKAETIVTVEITIASESSGAPGGDARLATAVERQGAATPAKEEPASAAEEEQAPEVAERQVVAMQVQEAPSPVTPWEQAHEMATTDTMAADASIASGGDVDASGAAQPSATAEQNGSGQRASSAQAGPYGSALAGGGALFGTGTGTGGAGTAGDVTGLLTPRPLAGIHPDYPRLARKAGWEGVVRINALVDDTGVVVSAEISATSGHSVLDQAALEAVRLTVFAPARQSGKAVFCHVIIPVRFQLK